MIRKNSCRNFNHGRILVHIQYCPDCGERFNVATDIQHCTDVKHAEKRKSYIFCSDCGESLSKKNKNMFHMF